MNNEKLEELFQTVITAQKKVDMFAVYQVAFNTILKEMKEFERLKGRSSELDKKNIDKFLDKTKTTLKVATDILEKM